MILALASLLLAAAQDVPPPPADEGPIIVPGRPYGPCGPRYAPLYVAPMGEPFRTSGASDPMARWFAGADRDRDGRVAPAEFAADADRFFATLDKDRDGELDPQEVSDYENFTAPEIKLYQASARFFRPPPQRGRDKRKSRDEARERADYQAVLGAGQHASLNVPEPVASADLDIDRGVSRQEFATVAARRFALLDVARQGTLAYATLPRSPAQQRIDACYAKEGK